MNKYQEYLMDIDHSYISYTLHEKENPCFDGEKITIKQDEDINVTRYNLHIANRSIECVYAMKGSQSKKIDESVDPLYSSPNGSEQKRFSLEIDFDNQIAAIKITFMNKIADDLIIPVVYEEADKEKYYAKKEQERKDNLLKKADIKVSTGADLVNIYFQPCCDEYDHTEILLYIPNEEVCRGRTSMGQEIVDILSWSLIKKCNVSTEDFYKSISGLAYGKYAFIIKQFDKNGNIILETDYITFKLQKPPKPQIDSWINII